MRKVNENFNENVRKILKKKFFKFKRFGINLLKIREKYVNN